MKLSDGIEIRVGRYGAEIISPNELTRKLAEELLAKPSGERELGIDPQTNLPVIAKSGHYGLYMTHGSDSRTLTSKDQLFMIKLEEANQICK